MSKVRLPVESGCGFEGPGGRRDVLVVMGNRMRLREVDGFGWGGW